MAASQPPLGLTQLMALDRVIVSQKTTYFDGNKYAVLAPDESLVMCAVEESTGWTAIFNGNARAFDMGIVDTQNNEVIRLRRPATFGPDKMEVAVCGQIASVIRQQRTWMKPALLVNDAADQLVFKVKRQQGLLRSHRDFEVFAGQTRVGVIKKVWKGWRRELFSRFNDFHVSFPQDLDVRYKCALIATTVLIDFLYYEP